MPLKLRSKDSCLVCKRRRKKCDEVHPKCGNCSRLSYACVWPTFDPEKDKQFIHGQSQSVMPKDPSLQAFQSTISEAFMVNVFTNGLHHSIETVDELSAMSVLVTRHFVSEREDTPGRMAWLACCYSAFADQFAVPAMKSESLSLYTKALSSLNRLCQAGIPESRLEVLATISLLVKYETYASVGGGSGFIYHAEGLRNLFETCGPEFFADPARLILFENLRWITALLSFVNRSNTTLSSPDWLTIPWSVVGIENKKNDQRLLDILFRVGEIRGKVDRVLASTNAKETTANLEDFWVFYGETLASLHKWYYENLFIGRRTQWQQTVGDAQDDLFPQGVPMFKFTIDAIVMSWYYSILNVMYSAGGVLCSLISFLGKSNEPNVANILCFQWLDADIYHEEMSREDQLNLPPNSGRLGSPWLGIAQVLHSRSYDAGRSACATVFYFLSDGTGEALKVHTLLPLVATMHTVESSDIGQWARQTFDAVALSEQFKDALVKSAKGFLL